MAATMRDVAQLAGVSQRTVSNVVNDYEHVKPETREKVHRAIAELRYRPNITAQRLRRGRTGIVALALPELSGYFAELAEILQNSAKSAGITVLIDQTGGDRARELLVLEGYRSSLIDALIYDPLAVTPQELEHIDLDIPVVLLGEHIDDSRFTHISIDNVEAAATATEHLLGGGRRRIAVLGASGPRHPPGPGPAEQRLRGFTSAMAEAGLPVPAHLAPRTLGWTRPAGHAATVQLMAHESPPDAIFCFNDLLAVGALKALRELGLRVPHDVAVVGWDDLAEASYTSPELTTIAPDKQAIARAAVQAVLIQLGQRPDTGALPRPAYSLIVRGSS